MTNSHDELVTVFESNDQGEIATAQAVLSGNGIQYFVANAISPSLAGLGILGQNPLVGQSKVQVRREDAPAALRILRPMLPPEPETADSSPIRRILITAAVFLGTLLLIFLAVYFGSGEY